MKKLRTFISLVFLSVLICTTLQNVTAVSASSGDAELGDQSLCIPGSMELFDTTGCALAGPAERLYDLAQLGITFPPQPLPIATPPSGLQYVPYTYAQVSNEEVSIYDSIDDAINGKTSGTLPKSHIKYVSLVNKEETSAGTFYQTAEGKWLSSTAVKRSGVPYYQGYLLTQNPTIPFGWIILPTESRSGPSYASESTGKTYNRLDLIRVYDRKTDGEIEWIMVGPDEWVDHKYVGVADLNYAKPEGVTANRWIEINLYEQVMTVHEEDRIVFATLIATGVDPFFTQPGVFQIYKKLDHDYMRGAFEADRSDYYYLEDVPYILYYDQSRALHGAYWHTLFGLVQSHGCVNLSVADSHWIYDWADVGDFVYVWDPSGKTPTDPSLYGAGGF